MRNAVRKDTWRHLRIMVSTVALLTLLAACGGEDVAANGSSVDNEPTADPGAAEDAETAAASGAATAEGDDDAVAGCETPSGPVRIYAVGPFTGDRAAQSLPVLHGAETAVSVLNEEGGIAGQEVELVVEDSRGDMSAAVAAAQDAAAADDVYGLILGGGSPEASAVEPILGGEGWPVFSVATTPAVTHETFPNFFRMNTLATDSVIPAVESAQEQGVSAIGLMVLNNDYGDGVAQSFERAADEAGIEVAETVHVAPTATNLAPEVIRLRDAEIDYVATALTPPQTLAAAEAGAAIGYEPTWQFNGADLAFPSTRNLLGDHAEGVEIRYVTFPLDPRLQTDPDMPLEETDMSEEARRFWASWYEEHGGMTEINGNEVAALPSYDWWSYDAIMMIAAAIEEGCAEPEGVVDAIEEIGSFELVASYPDIGTTHEFHAPDDLAVAILSADGTIDYDG